MKGKKKLCMILLMVSFVGNVIATVISNEKEAECQTYQGCGACISHAGCAYCRDRDYAAQYRCGTRYVHDE